MAYQCTLSARQVPGGFALTIYKQIGGVSK